MDYYNTSSSSLMTTTSLEPDKTTALTLILSYLCMGITCVFFGIFTLPIKHYKTGDGLFYQLLVGMGIWSVSIIVHGARGFPKVYPLPMLGGLFWATANLQTVPAIKLLGIGISQTITNLVSLIFGWAYARFGKLLFILNCIVNKSFGLY